MKKVSVIILAFILALSVCLIVACDKTPQEEPNKTYINLRSESEQKLDVGKSMKLMFDAYVEGKRVSDGATFESSDENVVTVDTFGNVNAVGGGTASVSITLKADATVKAVVNFTVTKTVFVMNPGYSNGDVDLTTADSKGWVNVKPGQQTQILASELSENWYFACTLEHTGNTGTDSSGRWGVGSFLVNDTNPIGNTMAWFGLKPTSHATKTYTPYVGGWRVQSTNQDPEIDICEAIPDSNVASFEIIRYGADLYCKITVGETVAKYVYSCPSLAGKPTYPGVYSQRQELLVSEISASSNMDEVMAKLQAFQTAEEVVIEGMGDTLFSGESYNLVATVLPDTTFDKGVKFALKETVAGVTLTEQGVLTIAANATGTFTVVATCDSDSTVTVERTYTITAKGTSESNLIDTTNTVGDNVTINDNSVTYANGGKTLLPLIVGDADKYAISFNSTLTAGKIGFVYATNGYCNYFMATVDGGKLTYGLMTGEQTTIACNTAAANAITIIRDGDYFLFVVNGKLVNRVKIELENATIPAIYGDGVVGTLSELTIVTTAAEVEEIITRYPHTVGAYVTDNGNGSYTIANKNFGSENDVNWPPVNNYENGLKFADTLTGDFTIEFKMSNIFVTNMSNGEYDGKVLIYLRSESKTASLQFCVKGKSGAQVIKFCPNLNDATWDEYEIPADVNLLNGENTIKVVKTNSVVELYINGTRVFEDNRGLNNNGYWNANTPCTPGIGTFCCGVTISDITLTTPVE